MVCQISLLTLLSYCCFCCCCGGGGSVVEIQNPRVFVVVYVVIIDFVFVNVVVLVYETLNPRGCLLTLLLLIDVVVLDIVFDVVVSFLLFLLLILKLRLCFL